MLSQPLEQGIEIIVLDNGSKLVRSKCGTSSINTPFVEVVLDLLLALTSKTDTISIANRSS
ncbi:MAG: hypothetical protein AAFX99_27400 [Myxococcota bacterium]